MNKKRRKYWIKSVHAKYVLLFVGIVWLSSGVAFAAVAPRAVGALLDNYTVRVQSLASDIQEFCSANDVDADQVAGLFAREDYEILVIGDYPELEQNDRYRNLISEADFNKVMEGELHTGTLESEFALPFAVAKAGEDLVFVRPHMVNNMVLHLKKNITTVLLICAGLGSVLIAVSTMVILRPVKKLTDATKEVAKGNFDIKVPVHSGDEIGQLTEHFNTMTSELKNIEYLRKDFISNVSHEFKTPITSIQGFTRLIRDRDITAAQFKEYTDIILSESIRLSNLSTNILRLSMLENQAIHEKKSRYPLDEQIRKAVLLLEDQWDRKNIDFDLDLESIEFLGHEELVQLIWINLVSNAVKFSRENETIRMSLKQTDTRVVFEIEDHGIGIPDDVKPRIFDRFFKGDPSRSEEGNGLGLAIVKKIVELHDGDISVESQAGKGTTFRVELDVEA